MLTRDQIQLVRLTWAHLLPNAAQVADLFYGRLFELDPSLRVLFRGDMRQQGIKLMQMVGMAVDHLDQLGEVVPAVRELGRRHVQYGVTDAHYDTVGTALLWALEQGLGEHFTPAMRDAWILVYNTLAKTMKDAAHQGVAAV